jgi:thymidylate synthase ThyX
MPTTSLVHCTPDAEKLVVRMARVSNPANQDNWDTGPKLLGYLIKHKHWSPFELVSMCVQIETERDIAAQILRHRSFSFQELCLAGDARIAVKAPGGTVQRIPIAQLHRCWQSPRFKARLARAYDQTLERFIEAPIRSVYASGRKPVYEFKIQAPYSVRAIRCTREHRVLTQERGFVPFGEAFDDGLTVALNGAAAEPLVYRRREVLEAGAWMGSERYAQEHGIAPVTARKWFRHHGIKPQKPRHWAASSIDLTFAGRLRSFMRWARRELRADRCQNCGHDGSASRLELSHIQAHDGDPGLAFDPSNLQTLCSKCHRRYDIDVQGKSYGWTLGMTAKWGRITKQQFLGVQETYDIDMDHPTHNFVADGVVVHNSTRYTQTGQAAPIELRRQDTKNRQNSFDDLPEDVAKRFTSQIHVLTRNLYLTYEEMLQAGVAKECARRILPLCTPTTLYMAGTARSWIHYIELRTSPDTQKEHRDVAEGCKQIFAAQFPNTAEALGWSVTP